MQVVEQMVCHKQVGLQELLAKPFIAPMQLSFKQDAVFLLSTTLHCPNSHFYQETWFQKYAIVSVFSLLCSAMSPCLSMSRLRLFAVRDLHACVSVAMIRSFCCRCFRA